jgi:hypothetical protein
MSLVFRTIIVSAADVAAARLACATVEGGQGMFTVQLTQNSDGSGPVTHYGSSGDVPEEILPLMWPSAAYITEDGPQAALASQGLYMYVEPGGGA